MYTFRWWLVIGLLGCLIFAFIGGAIEGTGSNNVTILTQPVIDNSTFLIVENSAGFNTSDYVMIGYEKIRYTSVTNATHIPIASRAYLNTPIQLHYTGDKVYSPEMGAVNAIFGYNVISTQSDTGAFDVATFGWNLITHAVPKTVFFDYSMFANMPWLIFRIFCVIVFGVPIILEACAMLATLGGGLIGILQRIL